MRAIKQEYSDYVVSVFALVIYYIHLQDKKTDWVISKTFHVITSTFFNVFWRFFLQNPNVTFMFFCFVAYVFSNNGYNVDRNTVDLQSNGSRTFKCYSTWPRSSLRGVAYLSIMTRGRMETLCSSDEMPSRIGDCWLTGRFLLNRLNDLESNASGMMYSFWVISLSITTTA